MTDFGGLPQFVSAESRTFPSDLSEHGPEEIMSAVDWEPVVVAKVLHRMSIFGSETRDLFVYLPRPWNIPHMKGTYPNGTNNTPLMDQG